MLKAQEEAAGKANDNLCADWLGNKTVKKKIYILGKVVGR